ncbi:MAG: hypothetical protein WC805_02145 [Patescibacteria group bacterium]|jgi:uncharacterized membrane-anchored protein YjiN (DUF445 family)
MKYQERMGENNMDNEEERETLEKIIALAQRNDSEGWKEIDATLPEIADSPAVVEWAKDNLDNEDSGLRDLAASTLELTNQELEDSDIENLLNLMQKTDEENPYPRFRAACALAQRSSDERIISLLDKIQSTLTEFTENEGVADIAKGYLQKTKNTSSQSE